MPEDICRIENEQSYCLAFPGLLEIAKKEGIMPKFAVFFLAVVCFTLAGCAQLMAPNIQDITLVNSFDPAEVEEAFAPGKNTIKGSAVILRNDGVAVTAAGRPVWLSPVTAYSTERMEHIYKSTLAGYNPAEPRAGGAFRFVNDDPSYGLLGMKTTVANAQGFFTFENLKDGDYYVATLITWNVANRIQGGAIMRRVSVYGGQVVEVVLSPHI